jgi:hypothetical protein
MTSKKAMTEILTLLFAQGQNDEQKVQKQIPPLRYGMTNERTTTEILALLFAQGQNDEQKV